MQLKRHTIAAILPLALAAAGGASAQSGHAILVRMGLGGHGGGPRSSASAGAASQGYLGIVFHDVSDDRLPALKLKESHGVEVLHVDHDGPASQAGLREHDVILQMNGQVIEGEEQLRRILRETPVGRGVTLVLSRDGQQLTVSTQMADRTTVERDAWKQHIEADSPPPSSFRGNGFFGAAPVAAPPITAPPDTRTHTFLGTVILGSSYTGAALEMIGPQLAQFFGSQGGNGLLVRSVEPNSPAATAGLRAGDVVVRANAVIISGTGDWVRLVRENRGRPVSVVVVRDKQEQTLVLVPDSRKRSSLEFQAYPLRLDPADQAETQAQIRSHAVDPMN
jgi:membrane-associated protease RseP (regulator of RpoE activity)